MMWPSAAHGFGCRFLHCFADTVSQEPSGTVRAEPKGTHKLMGADALLAGGHEVKAENPLVQGNVATLHDGSDRHGEGLTAFVALIQARTVALAFHLGDAGWVQVAAMRAIRTIRPADRNHAAKRSITVGKVNNRLLESLWKGFVLHSGDHCTSLLHMSQVY